MPIVSPRDDELLGLPVEKPIMVDSNAETNALAILEIERWCREHGLVRARENWLRTVLQGEVRVRRGVCYRPGPGTDEYRELEQAIEGRVANMPPTTDSMELRRGD
ncbi:MAG: hypothetical protein HYU66_16110 [Armatimonadetes bacterium]|nr:hypothetical protein [Armatimonadota bacterium]